MATIHSLNVALGLNFEAFTQGLQKAGQATRQFVTGGLNFQGMVKFATAAYGATRAVSVVGEGAKLIADNLRASDTEASRLLETFDAMATAAGRVETNIQKFGFVLGGAKSGFEAIQDWWQGNVPGGDPKAAAAAAQALEERRRQQEAFATNQAAMRKEQALIRKLRNELTGESELNRLGPRERRVVEARRSFGGLPGLDDVELRTLARQADVAERARNLSRRNAQRRLGDAFSVLAESQRPQTSRSGGGGTTAALALGTREEYMARIKAQQQADPDKQDERRHRREVERAIRETNKWLQKLLGATPQPGSL